MIPSNLCHVPLSVELLWSTTPLVFKPGSTTPRFQTRLTPLLSGGRLNPCSSHVFTPYARLSLKLRRVKLSYRQRGRERWRDRWGWFRWWLLTCLPSCPRIERSCQSGRWWRAIRRGPRCRYSWNRRRSFSCLEGRSRRGHMQLWSWTGIYVAPVSAKEISVTRKLLEPALRYGLLLSSMSLLEGRSNWSWAGSNLEGSSEKVLYKWASTNATPEK